MSPGACGGPRTIIIHFLLLSGQGSWKTASRGLRDAPRMERFSCGGQLTFTPSFVDRTLAITLRHTHHEPYDNHELSDAVLEFIGTYKNCSQPAEIFRNIQAARPEGWKSVTLHQVYYQWLQRTGDAILILSAQSLLSERSESSDVHSASYYVDWLSTSTTPSACFPRMLKN